MPSLFHARTGEATPLIPDLLFDIGLVFHEFIIFMCSIFFSDYQPSFPINLTSTVKQLILLNSVLSDVFKGDLQLYE